MAQACQAAFSEPTSPPTRPLAQVVTKLAAAMLTPQAGSTGSEPVAVVELTKQVAAAWYLRQRASCGALGHFLPTLIARAQTSAALLKDADQEQAGRVVVHSYNAASSLLKKLGDGPLALLAADRAVRAAQVTPTAYHPASLSDAASS